MKKLQSLLCIILCGIITLSGGLVSYAGENIGVSENPPYLNESSIQPYSTREPKEEWNLATKGRYNFSGYATVENLYTNYYFTGVSKVRIHVENKGSGTMTIKLLKKAFINSEIHSTDLSKSSSTTYTVSSLDSSKKYMILFQATGNFSGYIEKA